MKTVRLGDLLASISNAVAKGQHSLRRQHLRNFSAMFNRAKDGAMDPTVLPMRIPREHINEGDSDDRVASVPLATLTHHNQLDIDELTFEVDCLVEDYEEDEHGNGSIDLIIGSGVPRREGAARLSVTFKVNETPEGVSQVNDTLLKHGDVYKK